MKRVASCHELSKSAGEGKHQTQTTTPIITGEKLEPGASPADDIADAL